ncbi:MAG: ABC transporter ATP-binding protein [Pseudomonadota bacterium]
MSQSALLRLTGITHDYAAAEGEAQRVLEDFELQIAPGETVALWGPSGSGKTTILNLIAGLLEIQSGEVVVAPPGESPIALRRLDEEARSAYRRAHVGYVFQFFNLIETLTVGENIRLPLELAAAGRRRGGAGGDGWASSRDRLVALGLLHLEHRFPAALSGGEQQRVAVLRALAHRPALLLADEPTGNLDRANSERVVDVLWQEVREARTTMLIATHSDAVAARADRVVTIG